MSARSDSTRLQGNGRKVLAVLYFFQEKVIMKRLRFSVFALLVAGGLGFVRGTLHERKPRIALAQAPVAQAPADGKLRIIVFGAHPDDPEYRAAGVAIK